MPFRQALNIIVHLPLVLSPVVVGWMLLVVFGIRGSIGQLLNDWLGIRMVFTAAGAALACADRGLKDAAGNALFLSQLTPSAIQHLETAPEKPILAVFKSIGVQVL